ncbi:MAG: endonuclease, partial [Bacteroidales bacterium]|nr:endonuclease [Bacteroidales bacterium]
MKLKNSSGLVILLLMLAVQLATAAVPAGYYYQARNKTKAELKSSLSALAAPVKVLKYGSGEGATWQGFFHTDQNSDGSVIDMYSNIIRYFDGYTSISGMHIEHSLPKSWWGGAENMAYRDLFHLYPSDGSTNSSKSNHPLGIVKPGDATFDNGVSRIGTSSFSPAYSGKAFEPADEFKGDFARSYLYIATVYEHYAPLWTSPMM